MKRFAALLLSATIALAPVSVHAQASSFMPWHGLGTDNTEPFAPASAAGSTPFNSTYMPIGGIDSGTLVRGFRSDANGFFIVGVEPLGTAITCSSANVANAAATCTLAGVASKTTFISGFSCTASGATAALVVTATVAGLVTGTINYTFVFPAGVTAQATPLIVSFPTPVPASAANTGIVVTLPASGAGGTNATCNAVGSQVG